MLFLNTTSGSYNFDIVSPNGRAKNRLLVSLLLMGKLRMSGGARELMFFHSKLFY